MREKHTEEAESKGSYYYDGLEEFARQEIRQHLQELWEQEGAEW